MDFLNFLKSGFQCYITPSPDNVLQFAKDTCSLLEDKSISKVEKKVADAHLRAAIETAETIEYEKDKRAAMQRILTHLEQTYQCYLSYYNTCPKMYYTPYIPIISVLIDIPLMIREFAGGRDSAGEAIESLCLMIATYHRVINDSDELVERWLMNKRVETAYSKLHFIFYKDDSSEEDRMKMWLLGDELVKKYGSFIERNESGHTQSYDYYDDSHNWARDL